MARFISGLSLLLGWILRLSTLAISIWATFYLVHEGHAWAVVLWFFLLIPGFVLPFFTPLWALYLGVWALLILLAIIHGVSSERAAKPHYWKRTSSFEFPEPFGDQLSSPALTEPQTGNEVGMVALKEGGAAERRLDREGAIAPSVGCYRAVLTLDLSEKSNLWIEGEVGVDAEGFTFQPVEGAPRLLRFDDLQMALSPIKLQELPQIVSPSSNVPGPEIRASLGASTGSFMQFWFASPEFPAPRTTLMLAVPSEEEDGEIRASLPDGVRSIAEYPGPPDSFDVVHAESSFKKQRSRMRDKTSVLVSSYQMAVGTEGHYPARFVVSEKALYVLPLNFFREAWAIPLSSLCDWGFTRMVGFGEAQYRFLYRHNPATPRGSLELAVLQSRDDFELFGITIWGTEEQRRFLAFLTEFIDRNSPFAPLRDHEDRISWW